MFYFNCVIKLDHGKCTAMDNMKLRIPFLICFILMDFLRKDPTAELFYIPWFKLLFYLL